MIFIQVGVWTSSSTEKRHQRHKSCLVSDPFVNKVDMSCDPSSRTFVIHLSSASQICPNICVTHLVALPLFTNFEVHESAV